MRNEPQTFSKKCRRTTPSTCWMRWTKKSAEQLFDLMEDDEKADVAELMDFEHDTAGGLMTTEFVVFPQGPDRRRDDRSASRNGRNAEHDLLPVRRR